MKFKTKVKNFFKLISKPVLAMTLMVVLIAPMGCSSAQFFSVLNEVAPAALDILQIVALFSGKPVSQGAVAKIDADVAALEKLYTDFEAAKAAGTDTSVLLNDLNAGFSTLNADISSVLAIAQVSDPATQAKIEALILIVQSAVNIAEAIIHPAVSASPNHVALSAADLADSYNKTLKAKTGNQLVDNYTKHHAVHSRGSLVYHLSLTLVK